MPAYDFVRQLILLLGGLLWNVEWLYMAFDLGYYIHLNIYIVYIDKYTLGVQI